MDAPRRLDETARTLDVLGILFYVHGGLAAFFGLFPIVHVVLGIFALLNPNEFGGEEEARVMGALFLGIGLFTMLGAWTLAGFSIATGRFLRQRRRKLFCTVGAAVTCLAVPLGTALGVVTLVFLGRPETARLFGAPGTAWSPGEPVRADPVDAPPV